MTIGGIFLAVAYAIGDTQTVFENTGSAGWFLAQVGTAGLTIMVPILGGYIAYAIADRPGLAPGFLLAYILQQGNVVAEAATVIGISGGEAGAGYLAQSSLGCWPGTSRVSSRTSTSPSSSSR